ncbi:hypothetical protein VTK73DRAFT_3920 [Phialemonium thermophilum]|uniref:THUMP domain-containing protein n=1 Tax=Phialemonium thermophilum TaxID=223376 RepID=A0ABR3WWG5_9PEZI
MPPAPKRKEFPTEAADHQAKKKKHGNEGKWKTPHHHSKTAALIGGSVTPGDVGIWVTCARGQEQKAAREVTTLFEEYAEMLYGVKAEPDDIAENGDQGDVEALVRRELEAMKPMKTADSRLFTPIKMNVDCLLFVKTKPPVVPTEFVRRICQDAKAACGDPRKMRSRYVNRFTPVTLVGKATEQGIADVAREVLAPWFDLSGKKTPALPLESDEKPESVWDHARSEAALRDGGNRGSGADNAVETEKETASPSEGSQRPPSSSFAIRASVRNQSILKRDNVIHQIAGMINDDRHRVNLTAPDKVILVDVYQNVCGISVVEGDWDDLKRYNLSELYNPSSHRTES